MIGDKTLYLHTIEQARLLISFPVQTRKLGSFPDLISGLDGAMVCHRERDIAPW